MRQLTTIRTVSELRPIEGADRIELAVIDGWQCVVKKGEFNAGDKGLYLEIDSMVPTVDPRFNFLAKGKVVEYARVKTVRLKKALSQGLLMPLKDFPEVVAAKPEDSLSDLLGVKIYEPPMPIGGKQKGTFPTHLVPKTDQERIQNMKEVLVGRSIVEFEVTEKLDGTSCTMWMRIGQDDLGMLDIDINKPEDIEKWKDFGCGVASRNFEMKKDDENVYAKMLRENGMVEKFWQLGRNLAIQGEIIGPAIQGNKYHLTKQEFFVFEMFDIDKQQRLGSEERLALAEQLGLKHAPVLTFDADTAMTLENVLAIADGPSVLNPSAMREGLVFKALDGSVSFKAISNEWLLKHE